MLAVTLYGIAGPGPALPWVGFNEKNALVGPALLSAIGGRLP